MRDIAITAGVNDTLPVIAQGWFCGSSRKWTVERFPKRASVAGNPGVAASSETVSHGGTAKAGKARPDATAPLVRMRHPQFAARRERALVTTQVQTGGRTRVMAEVKFTSANAVWVAGPDRIFFPACVSSEFLAIPTPH
jgi:hypothetical protein